MATIHDLEMKSISAMDDGEAMRLLSTIRNRRLAPVSNPHKGVKKAKAATGGTRKSRSAPSRKANVADVVKNATPEQLERLRNLLKG